MCAKLAYRFKLEKEAATNDLNAGLSARLAREKRALIEQLNKEADAMDARIKEVAEMEENGFYACEKDTSALLTGVMRIEEHMDAMCVR